MTENGFVQIKNLVLEELKKLYVPQTVSLWLEPMKIVSVGKSSVTLSFPQYAKTFAEAQYGEVLREKFSAVLGAEMDIVVVSEEEVPELDMPEEKEVSAYKMRFSKDYTFENFVVGKSNQLAQSASLAVSQHPAELNNPLYLYGPSGLGKTHLLFAIVNKLRADHPEFNILYVTAEEFTTELIDSLAKKQPMIFREKYRTVDVLLVDDIQFISGKMAVQEEFFHTFDTLFKLNKQIIIASDCAPKDIGNLEDRLKSRFEMGLVADIQPPDMELRIAIFKRKAMDFGYNVPFEVLYYLAENITTNIRQIEGSLKKLKAHTLITGEQCNYAVARKVLTDFFEQAKSEESVIDRIFELADKRYGVTKEQLKSSKRNAEITVARHFCMYLIRHTTDLSQNSIAKLFNKKDHSTVINSIGFIERKMLNDPNFKRDIEHIIAELRS